MGPNEIFAAKLPAFNDDGQIAWVRASQGGALDRVLAFYCGVLGFQLTKRYGRAAAFISAGGYHHQIGLNTWESLGGSPARQSASIIGRAFFRGLPILFRHFLRASLPHDGHSAGPVLDFALVLQIL
jgi:catechol 2,3-dioxygenase-like lactoylglutathione lyase family enzyme